MQSRNPVPGASATSLEESISLLAKVALDGQSYLVLRCLLSPPEESPEPLYLLTLVVPPPLNFHVCVCAARMCMCVMCVRCRYTYSACVRANLCR